jgi:predicted dehydrogenase
MARNTAECDAMIAACERAGVKLGVAFQGRFEPLSLKLKAGLDAGRIGALLWASANTLWHRTDAYYASAPWRGTWAHEGGGVLINQAIHAIDLLLSLTGMPEKITARTRTLNHQIEVEDAALAILEFADGRLGLIQATTIAHPGFPERLEFFGANGSAVFNKGEARLEWRVAEPAGEFVEQAEVSSGAARPMDITAAGHTALYRDFVDAIRGGRASLVDGREGRKSVAVVEAIYRSAESGGTVEVG